ALEKVGMKVTDSTRSQGSMAVTYKPLSVRDWRDLGASDPGLASGEYKLQVGDLDNRSRLKFIVPMGHTLTQSQNDALVA
ncbi:outer membrane protein assembly factor BamC, partial [Salmonella enterica]|uniref:outer membrane protein assembly factor BamC n=1 Tax=Salmonella enterica TaxID=28901 RepID=UPI001F4088DF